MYQYVNLNWFRFTSSGGGKRAFGAPPKFNTPWIKKSIYIGDQRTYRVPLFTPPIATLRRHPLPTPEQALELWQLLSLHRLAIPMSFYCEAGSPIHLLYHSYLQLGRLKALGIENAIRQQIEANLPNTLFVEGTLELLQKLEAEFRRHLDQPFPSRFCSNCYHLGHQYINCSTYRCAGCNKWSPAHALE